MARHLLLLIRVMWDFVRGMYAFHSIEPCVAVFGSARLTSNAPAYQQALAVGKALGANGITIMTGGGPGLMEAASRGAHESGGRCIGCRISLSLEQRKNNYIHHGVTFNYFFVRKVMLVRHSCALIVLPGGLGTLDELFEVLTLIQTKKIAPIPIVFIGREYWQPLLNVIEHMLAAGTINVAEKDLVTKLMIVTDQVGEAIAHVKANTTAFSGAQTKAPTGEALSSDHRRGAAAQRIS